MGERAGHVYRFLVGRQGNQWLAQSVDFDLAAQAPDQEAVIAAFARVLRAHRQRAYELGMIPFANLPEAPIKFVQAWDSIVRYERVRLIEVQGGDHLPPAYLAEALISNGQEFNLGH